MLIFFIVATIATLAASFLLFKLLHKPDVKKLASPQASQQKPIQSSSPAPQTMPQKQEELVVGSIADLSAGAYETHGQIIRGVNLRFERANKSNEIPNIKIKFIVLDHQYEESIALKQIKVLHDNYGIKIILAPTGTMTLKACLPFIKEKNMLVLFPAVGSRIFRQPDQTNIISYKCSYAHEVNALIGYAINELLFKKFAIFYQNDDFGNDALTEAVSLLEKSGLKKEIDWIETNYKKNSNDIANAAKEIEQYAPTCIMLFSMVTPTTALLSQLSCSPSLFLFGISTTNAGNFLNTIKTKGIKFVRTHVIPNKIELNFEITKKFLNDADLKQLPTEDYFLEGYISASIFIEALKQIQPPITADKIKQKIESFQNYNMDGLNLKFNPNTRQLSNLLWLELPNGEWIYSPIKEPNI